MIYLVNVDAPFNYAIRKMYRYHRERGDEVDMINLGFKGYPHKKEYTMLVNPEDEVYISNIFELNQDRVKVYGTDKIYRGGVGSREPLNVLPKEIDDLEPWYFPNEDTAHGFITRGCIRKCYFCKVHPTEGYLRFYRDIEKIADGKKKVVLHDNNFLAYDGCIEQLRKMHDMKLKVDFNQGLDFRLVTEENMEAWVDVMSLTGNRQFSFDNWAEREELDKAMLIMKKYFPRAWVIRFCMYVNPSMDLMDVMHRMEWCRQNEALPYLMRDSSCWGSEHQLFITDLTAYCNQPHQFKRKTFREFMEWRFPKNEERVDYESNLYESLERKVKL